MDRLKTLMCIIAAVCPGHIVMAQAMPDAGRPAGEQGTICVVGDVQRPSVYPLPAGSRVTLRDAVASAGMASETANVTVLRTAQGNHQWTQFISRSAGDGGPPLFAGDVVIVVSMNAPDQQVSANAAVITPMQNLVIGLSEGPVVVGDVLSRLGIPPEAVGGVQVISFASNGPARSQASAASVISHACVMRLTSQGSGLGHGPVQTASRASWSEWNSGQAVSPGVAGYPADQAPASTVPASAQYPPTAVPPEPDAAAVVIPAEPADSSSFGGLRIPGITAGYDLGVGDQHASPFHVVSESGQEMMQAQDGTGGTAEFTESAAPEPPLESDLASGDLFLDNELDSASAAGLNLWNLTVICGLLVGGGLILAGWYRSQASLTAAESCRSRQEPLTSRSSQSAASHANGDVRRETPAVADALVRDHVAASAPVVAATSAAASAAQTTMVAATVTEESQRIIAEDAFPAIVTRQPQSLVAAGEWFSRDTWATLQPPAIRDSGDDPESTERHDRASRSDVLTARQETKPEPTRPVAQRAMPTQRATDRVDDVGTPAPTTTTAAHEESSATAASDAERLMHELVGDPPAAAPAGDLFGDLEDLVQNRLPIDLCAANLPLRVTLFGRAAGPRRLRIDAAHTTLQGPHMPMRAGAAGRGNQDATAAESRGNAAGLDRALQSVNERNST